MRYFLRLLPHYILYIARTIYVARIIAITFAY